MWGCIKIFVNKVMLGFTEIFLGTKFNSHTKFFSPFYMSQNSLYGSTSSRKIGFIIYCMQFSQLSQRHKTLI